MQVKIPCPHESRQVKDFREVLANHHPLSKEEIAELLKLAKNSKHPLTSHIQDRLNQGIVGMVCPRPTTDKMAEKARELNSFFVKVLRKGAKPAHVERFHQIMTA